MPNVPKPVGSDGAIPPIWNGVLKGLANLVKRVTALESQQTQIIKDGFGNAVVIIGQLSQTVTEGASFGVPGTQASTGLTGQGIATHKSGSWVQIG